MLPTALFTQGNRERPDEVTYNFPDHELVGTLNGPNLEVFQGDPEIDRTSLIIVRDSFMGEMIQSVEDL